MGIFTKNPSKTARSVTRVNRRKSHTRSSEIAHWVAGNRISDRRFITGSPEFVNGGSGPGPIVTGSLGIVGFNSGSRVSGFLGPRVFAGNPLESPAFPGFRARRFSLSRSLTLCLSFPLSLSSHLTVSQTHDLFLILSLSRIFVSLGQKEERRRKKKGRRRRKEKKEEKEKEEREERKRSSSRGLLSTKKRKEKNEKKEKKRDKGEKDGKLLKCPSTLILLFVNCYLTLSH
jgi:hypothetical protein